MNDELHVPSWFSNVFAAGAMGIVSLVANSVRKLRNRPEEVLATMTEKLEDHQKSDDMEFERLSNRMDSAYQSLHEKIDQATARQTQHTIEILTAIRNRGGR